MTDASEKSVKSIRQIASLRDLHPIEGANYSRITELRVFIWFCGS